MASVVGKLMFASDVVPGLRALLAPCYWALQEFVERPDGDGFDHRPGRRRTVRLMLGGDKANDLT